MLTFASVIGTEEELSSERCTSGPISISNACTGWLCWIGEHELVWESTAQKILLHLHLY